MQKKNRIKSSLKAIVLIVVTLVLLSLWSATTVTSVDKLRQQEIQPASNHSSKGVLMDLSLVDPPTDQPGWPIYAGSSQRPGIAVYGDVDPDYPGLEVVIAVESAISHLTRLYVRHQDGTPAPGFDPYMEIVQAGVSPAVADLDGDGLSEIILPTNAGGGYPPRLYVFEHNGTDKPGWPQNLSVFTSMPVIADLNNDGFQEIVVTGGWELSVFNHNGTNYNPAVWPKQFSEPLNTPAVANLDEDPNLEIVTTGTYGVRVFVLNDDGTMLWEKTIDPTYTGFTPAVGDIDEDGELEIVVGAGCASDWGKIYVFNADGSLAYGWPQKVNVKGALPHNVVIADLDRDYPGLELITAPGYGVISVFAFHADGSRVPGWPVLTGTSMDNSPAVCDLDGDAQLEVLVPTGHNQPRHRLYIIRSDGSFFCSPIDTLSRAESPAVGDIDDDGIVEIIQPGGGNYIFVWEFTSFQGGGSQWPMVGGNAVHNGQYSPSTIYVDDDNTVGPWDGTQEKPYQTVQEGIDNAKTLDVVFTDDGTYYENILIDKPVYLIGEDRTNTIIDAAGTGVGITLSVDGVNVQGFTIRNSTISGVHINSNFNMIAGNVITGNYYGIYVNDSSTNNTVYHNSFISNTVPAYDPFSNIWDAGYPSGGNFWDEYIGDDLYYGPNQDALGGDGIGDTSYSIAGGGNLDNYPLISPWSDIFSVPARDIVYVDDDFDHTTPGWGWDHFQEIQQGIDAVTLDGMVQVANGRYYEQIFIDKCINLYGENKNDTVIDGCASVLHSEDFEIDSGGYSHSGLSDLWEWGVPSVGPGAVHSGSKCWGTVLDGSYSNNANAILETGSIRLPSRNAISLKFWHWYEMDTYYDGGNVKISTDGGVTWALLGSAAGVYDWGAASPDNMGIPGEPCFSGFQTEWKQAGFDISNYAGEDVIIRWHFGSDGSINYSGWYIDDVEITTPRSTVVTMSTLWANISGFKVTNGTAGIFLYNADNNNIFDNFVTGNDEAGIYLRGYSSYNHVYGNTVTNSVEHGIYLWESDDNILYGNTVMDNRENGFNIYESSYLTVSNNTVVNNEITGIKMYHGSSHNIVSDNYIENNLDGIYLSGFETTLASNEILNNDNGITLSGSINNTLYNNTIYYNTNGITVDNSNNNLFYKNNFNNIYNANDPYDNTWYNFTLQQGNYWDDYQGIDENGDNIGDTPYDVPGGNNQDLYPLMHPYGITIFVDDDQIPSWYDATHVQTIQEGITNATDGYAVYVYPGIYPENIVINKPLHLLGQQGENVIIDGGGSSDVVTVTADRVRIKGFIIQHSGSTDAGITIWSKNNTISRNTIIDNYDGVILRATVGNTIYHNNITNNNCGIRQASLTIYKAFIYHNNFFANTLHADDSGTTDWDNGYPSGGNYWDDYTDDDLYYGPNQDIPGSDGIGDIPHDIPGGIRQDRYPLINPWNGTSPVPPLDTVYVDDDFNSSTPGWGWDRFNRIQNGINTVLDDGTVHVANGTYYEHVVIEKPLNIIGEHRNSTVINGRGTGDGILITGDDGVTITGFMITNCTNGIAFYFSGNYNTVAHNLIVDNEIGIWIKFSVYNTITDTIFSKNTYGISVDHSQYNTISENTFVNNDQGIYVYVASENTILKNTFKTNAFGCYAHHSTNNSVYLNVFFNNDQNAYDNMDNTWDDGYPSGGNYWDDYIGEDYYSGPDQNTPGSDGIGDTPYDILGGEKQDRYPLMKPLSLYADAHGPYAAYVNDSVNFTGYAHGGTSPYTWQWDFGDGNTSNQQNISHTYAHYGVYIATLTVTDNNNVISIDTAEVTITSRPVWVDDDFNSSTPGWQIDHFNTIQDAVDAVGVGGTVHVSMGAYTENILISKTIFLVGEDEYSTVLDGIGGDAITLSADQIHITGLTITNGSTGIVLNGSSNVEIYWNRIMEHQLGGVYLATNSNHNYIVENTIKKTGDYSIAIYQSRENRIYGNNLADSKNGIILNSSMDGRIVSNIVTRNEIGFYAYASANNYIYYNDFISNNQSAYDNGYNDWNRPYPWSGNHWSDYTGEDYHNGPWQDLPGSDGIGDTPYDIPGGNNQDNYPRMNPYNPTYCGDCNNDWIIDVGDVVYLINYLYKNGPAPQPELCRGDSNGDGIVNLGDVVHLLNYLYRNGSPPVPDCCW